MAAKKANRKKENGVCKHKEWFSIPCHCKFGINDCNKMIPVCSSCRAPMHDGITQCSAKRTPELLGE